MKYLKLGAVLVSVGIVGIICLRSTDEPHNESLSFAPCARPAGTSFMYDLSYALQNQVQNQKSNASPFAQLADHQSLEIKGLLSLKYIEEKRVAFLLTPKVYKMLGYDVAEPASEFAHAVEVEFDDHCQVQHLAFDGRQPFRSREILRSIIGLSAADARAILNDSYSGEEEDVIGRVAVSYSFNDAKGLLRKQRTAVTVPSATGAYRELSAEIQRSTAEIKVQHHSDSAPWLSSITAEETLLVKRRDDGTSGIQKTMLKLAPSRQTQSQTIAKIPAGRRVDKRPSEPFKGRDAVTAYSSAELRRHDSPEAWLEALALFEQKMQEGDAVLAKKFLGAHLLKHPEHLSSLERLLESGEFDDEASAHILFLLARLDLPQAQQVMVHLIESDQAEDVLRVQTIIAISDVVRPDDDTKRLLSELASKFPPSSPDPDDELDMPQRIFSTALNAYGTMAERAREVDPAFESEALEKFRALMSDDSRVDIVQTALDGASNFAHDELLDPIATHLTAADEGIRSSAARAVSRIDNDQAEAILVGHFRAEASPDVRRAMAQGLAERGRLARDHVRLIATELGREATPETRRYLVDTLGRVSSHYSEAKDALISAAAKEEDARTLQHIGRYANAADLSHVVSRR